MDMISVACAVIFSEGKALAALRPQHKSEGGRWEFPGGKLEKSESTHSALVREIKEELAIDVQVIKNLTPVLLSYPNRKDICLLPFVCIWKGGELELLDHDEIRWLPRAGLFDLNWALGDRSITGEVISEWNLIQEKLLIYSI